MLRRLRSARRRPCALARSEAGGLCPSARAQLSQDPAHVVLGGLDADPQPLGDLMIGQALRYEGQDLSLALG